MAYKIAMEIAALNREEFQVRQHLEYVEKYSNEDAFQYLDIIEAERLCSNVANLIPQSEGDEYARRFDVLMLQIMVAKVTGENDKFDKFAKTVKRSAAVLQQKATIPEVYAAKETLEKVSNDSFWAEVTLPELEKIREELRGLMHFLRREIKTKVINVTDDVIFEREGERFTQESNLESYYERAYRYVEENLDKPVLHKLRNNVTLSQDDWDTLEKIFWGEVGTEDEYKKEIHSEENEAVPLGKFVRSLTGLNPETAHQAFSEFLDIGKYTEEQVYFVNCIVDYVSQYGTLDQREMADDEFAGGLRVVEVFSENMTEFKKIMAVVNSINSNAMPMAA